MKNFLQNNNNLATTHSAKIKGTVYILEEWKFFNRFLYKEALKVCEDILKLNINGLLIPNSYLYKALILKELKIIVLIDNSSRNTYKKIKWCKAFDLVMNSVIKYAATQKFSETIYKKHLVWLLNH